MLQSQLLQQTALMWAAENGYTEVVSSLLESGAAVDIENTKGETPLTKAADRGYNYFSSLTWNSEN